MPGASPEEVTPNDNEPRAAAGNTTHEADLARVTAGVPIPAESVEDLFAVLPFCITEKESDDGENESTLPAITVRVTFNVALLYPAAEAVTVEV